MSRPRTTTCIHPARLALCAALAFLLHVLPGCGGESQAAPQAPASKPAPHAMHITPPSPSSLEGQHGGFFSVGLRVEREYDGPEKLSPKHPLYARFQAEAKAAYARLTWEGKPLQDLLRADAKAAALWKAAMRAPVAADSRRDGKDGWLVVVKTDVLPLTRYLRTGN